jgi:acylphosphatase
MAQERRTVRFIGEVQGVGFRYTALRLAGGYDVAGYVRNLPDGSVEVVVEGDDQQIDLFLERLRDRMSPYITDEKQTVSTAHGDFNSFGIRP